MECEIHKELLVFCSKFCSSKQTIETENALHRYGNALAWDNALRFYS